ncbi:hypothetical protein HS125_20105 [bacterium]|nr:hypothetical protein [bacterium]
MLSGNVRVMDFVARYGGKFMVILPHCALPAAGQAGASRGAVERRRWYRLQVAGDAVGRVEPFGQRPHGRRIDPADRRGAVQAKAEGRNCVRGSAPPLRNPA